MLIAVVSDTHRDKSIIKKLGKTIEKADMMIHLGDNVADAEELGKVYKNKIINVRGNCDFGLRTPLERVEEISGVKILITHGHKYDVKNNLTQLRNRAEELKVNIALFGHTHVSEISFEDGIWFINPGSASLPRDGQKSIAFIELKDGEIGPSVHSI